MKIKFENTEASNFSIRRLGGKNTENCGKAICEVSMDKVHLEINAIAVICLEGSSQQMFYFCFLPFPLVLPGT